MKNLKAIRRVLYVTLALNLVAMAAKLIVGYWTGALSLIADGFDSLFDGAGNVIGLVGIYIASRPADREHPYGHRKFETMSAIAIALLLFLTTWELLQSALERLRDPALIQPEVTALSFGALLVSIAVHVTVVIYELRAGRRLKSDVLVADAMHTRADIYISLSVIGGLVAVRLGYPIVDPLLALVIAILIAKIGIDIIRESSKTLLDGAVVPIGEIERVVMGLRDVRACHTIRSRGHEDAIYVDLHVEVAPEMTTAQSHAVAHDVQYRLRAEFPSIQDVVVHVEPGGVGAGHAESAIPALRTLADASGVAIHDIAARSEADGVHLDTHLTLDGDMPLSEAHEIADRLEGRARSEIPRLAEITTHIEPASAGEEGAPAPTASADEVIAVVRDVLLASGDLARCHSLQTYPVGRGWVVSLHLTLDGAIPLRAAHDASTQVEERLLDAVPRLERVIVHVEPAR